MLFGHCEILNSTGNAKENALQPEIPLPRWSFDLITHRWATHPARPQNHNSRMWFDTANTKQRSNTHAHRCAGCSTLFESSTHFASGSVFQFGVPQTSPKYRYICDIWRTVHLQPQQHVGWQSLRVACTTNNEQPTQTPHKPSQQRPPAIMRVRVFVCVQILPANTQRCNRVGYKIVSVSVCVELIQRNCSQSRAFNLESGLDIFDTFRNTKLYEFPMIFRCTSGESIVSCPLGVFSVRPVYFKYERRKERSVAACAGI